MATQDASAIGALKGPAWAKYQEVTNTAGSIGKHSRNEKVVAPGGLDVVPILCVSTWEHVWLPDWGVGGKGNFLEAWWNRINWNVVYDGVPRNKQVEKVVNNHGP